jgi:chromate transporter
MRRDLVEERRWLSEREYDDGLAIAAACPGPLAYQLAVYCGYVRFGVLGGLAVAAAFAFTPFFLVVGAAYAYTRFAAAWQLRALFYGIGPVVVALILKACWNLGKKTLRRDRLAWLFFVVACGVTVLVQRELAPLFVVAGVLGVFLFAQPGPGASAGPKEPPPVTAGRGVPLLLPAIAGASGGMTLKLFLFFFKTGLLVFGSGLVIVPFLKTYVVDQYHWLGNREFLDSVAIGMISPGPVVITATFVGFLLKGVPGALAATAGIFSPAVLFTLLATPLLLRYRDNPRLRGFIRGVTVAVVGVLVGTTYLVGKTAIGDWPTAGIGIATLVVLFATRKIPEPVIVLAGGLIGLAAFQLIRPEWVLH